MEHVLIPFMAPPVTALAGAGIERLPKRYQITDDMKLDESCH